MHQIADSTHFNRELREAVSARRYAMLGILAFIFGASVLSTPLHRWLGARAAWLLSGVPAVACGYLLWMVHRTPMNPLERYSWLPRLGIEMALLLDGLALLFAVLILGIGVAVLAYSAAYLRHSDRLGSFFTRMLFFTGSMLGLVIADDLFSLYVFWEMTTVASFFLIGWHPEKIEVRDAARSALLVTSAGGLLLMAALVAMVMATGSPADGGPMALRISVLNDIGLQGESSYSVIVVLVLVAAMAKSAQAPLWFWLPAAMQAPTPVSAYLHSATMVKAGVFLLARFSPALAGTSLWTLLLTTVGGVTMVLAGMGALAQSDLKRLLAFSTISILGAIIFLLGIGSGQAASAAVVLIVAHALYKAALFLVAGNVEKATGTRELSELGGLARHLPLTAATALLAAASLAALPPFLGYVAKEKLYAAALENLGVLGLVIAVLGGLTMVAAALRVALGPFFGSRPASELQPVPLGMVVPSFVLALLGFVVTFVPGPLLGWMSRAASAIAASPQAVELSLWPGTNDKGLTILAASVVSVAAGFLLYALRSKASVVFTVGLGDRALRISDVLAHRLGQLVMLGVKPVTRWHQNGRLRSYLRTILLVATAAGLVPLVYDVPPLAGGLSITWLEAGAYGLTIFGALGVVVLPRSLAAVACLGTAGVGIVLLFGIFSAPDLAIAQVLIEALIVVMFVLTFYRLGVRDVADSRAEKLRDAALAASVGISVTLLVLIAVATPLEPTVSRDIARASVPVGRGHNIVNVILVDVRSLDTLGEITVLGTSALGVLALLLGRKERE